MRTRHHLIPAILVALLFPLFAACATIMPTQQATQPRMIIDMPTAIVRAPTLPEPVVVPQAMPQISQDNVPAIATLVPLPTAVPPALLATTQPTGLDGNPFPPRTGQLQFGAAAHLFYTDRYTPLNRAQEAGLGWVRQQIHWRDQEGEGKFYAWGELDGIVDDVNAHGMKLLLSIVRSPSWYTANGGDGMPADPKAFGDFVAALATHYQGRVHAIQIWNEQNLAAENGGSVDISDAGRYVELIKEAYTRIKQVDPSIIVVSGAPASTATNGPGIAISDLRYYRAMFEYQGGIFRNYVDAVAVHPGGSANAPETLWPNEPSNAQGWTNEPTFYFRNIENVRALMVQYGMASHPVWITEFGWATANDTPGFEFGQQISFDTQADYIRRAMLLTAEKYPWVDAMFVWNLNFAPLRAESGDPNHEQASFGILDAGYQPRPAFFAVQQTISEIRGQGR